MTVRITEFKPFLFHISPFSSEHGGRSECHEKTTNWLDCRTRCSLSNVKVKVFSFSMLSCCLDSFFSLSLFIADSGRCKWIYFRKEWSSDRAGFCVVYKRKRQRPLKEDQMAQIFPWPTRRRSLSRTTKKVKWNIEIPFWRRIALVHPTVPDMLLSKAIAVAFFKEENLVSLRLWKNCRVLTAAVRRLPYIIYHPPCHWSCRCVNQDNVVITLDDQLVTRFVLQGRLFSFTSVPVRISLSKKKKTKTV